MANEANEPPEFEFIDDAREKDYVLSVKEVHNFENFVQGDLDAPTIPENLSVILLPMTKTFLSWDMSYDCN